MTEDVSKRARERAAEARERAREAGARAAELAGGEQIDRESALARSRKAVERAVHLAKEGYRHAADAERAAARAHETVAESIEKRLARSPELDELRSQALKHRRDAEEHLRKAKLDEQQLAELDQKAADPDPGRG